jgi:site-specific recombinase XerC
MNEAVKTTLLRLSKTAKEKFVFLDKDRNPLEVHHLYREFAKVQKKVGMDQIIRFHDLRHCFASHFMMSGGNLYDLQRILGHTQYAMTQIYAHLSPDYLSGTTQILSFGKMSIEEEKSRPELVIL